MADTQVLVIGSGAAGLRAATDLADRGVEVVLVSRGELTDSATDWAQGGLAAVHLPTDSTLSHVNDTLEAGAGLCDPVAVTRLVEGAPGAIDRLIADGAVFDHAPDGSVDLHLEGGHHARRIWHADGDRSGHEVERTLVGVLDHRRITGLDHTRAVGLLVDDRGRVCGARLRATTGVLDVTSDAVVLATGGIGQLWQTTTNPFVSTGDGLALGLAAGAIGRDLEFMQFHPTVIAAPGGRRLHDGRQVLVSEAVRGEGAVLVDGFGDRVMAGVHPLGDLAPRDVVSAAEHAHMVRIGADHLYLDATGFGAATWQHKFPGILEMCLELGIDPVNEPIPVRPGAHYHCGGLAADMAGRTSVSGLYAIGEVACTGVQGANRLASNSLTESLVMGATLAASLDRDLPRGARPVDVRRPNGVAMTLAGIQQVMTAKVGLLRTGPGLVSALAELGSADLEPSLDDAALDAASAHLVARALASAAWARTESRGCHRRADHPEPRPQWLRHIDITLDDLGHLENLKELAA